MGESPYPDLDPVREAAIAKENADALLGKADEQANAQKQFAEALNNNSEKERDILLKIVGALEDLATNNEVQTNEELKELKKLASDVANEFSRTYMKSAPTAEDINALGARLAEVLTSPQRKQVGSSGAAMDFAKLQDEAKEFAQTITDAANESAAKIEEQVENHLARLDKGLAPPMVGSVKGFSDPNFQPGGEAPDIVSQLGDLAEDISNPIVEAFSGITSSVDKAMSSGSESTDKLMTFMKEEAEKNDRREQEKAEKAEEAARGPGLADKLKDAVTGGLRTAMGDPMKLLGFLSGTLLSLKDEVILSLEEIGKWINGLWPAAKKWLAKTLGPLGVAIGKVGDLLGKLKDWIIKGLLDMATKVGRVITDAMGLTKSEKELHAERGAMLSEGAQLTATKFAGEGGKAGQMVQTALQEGIKPAHATWFGLMAKNDPNKASEAYDAYKAALASGKTADQAFYAASDVMRAPKPPVTPAPTVSAGPAGIAAVDQAAQMKMARGSGDTAVAVDKMTVAIKEQSAMIARQMKDQPKRSGEVAPTIDSVGKGDATGMDSYASGQLSGGTV